MTLADTGVISAISMNINGLVAKIVSIHEHSQFFCQNNDEFSDCKASINWVVILLTYSAERVFVTEGVA